VGATVLQVLRLALSVITDRVLTIFTLWMTFGLTCWAMYSPTVERLELVAGFALIVYVPSLIKERRREGSVKSEHE
jgi:hypothetical protein